MAAGSVVRVGAYLPLLRLERRCALAATAWSGLGGARDGVRAVAGWDEDAVTLAVEAARGVAAAVAPDSVVFASTSAPYVERAHAPLLIDALALPPQTRTQDVAGTRRCAASALLAGLKMPGSTIIAAGEKRQAPPGAGAHLAYGDGAAAVLVHDQPGPATLLGAASLSRDLIDVYASRAHPFPYASEERFVREAAVSDVLAPTILAACDIAGIAPSDIRHAAVHEPVSGVFKKLAAKIGLGAIENHAARLSLLAGDLGSAHALFALCLAFDACSPGDIVLLAGFGSGCDALVFRVSAPVPGASAAAIALRDGVVLRDYVRFLALSGNLAVDWGPRAETEQKAAATVLNRVGRDTAGFIGGRDARGNVQFPKSPIPVHPGARMVEALEDVRLADLPARVISVTADRLNTTPDPPFLFGLVQFDNGARVMMEFCDASAGDIHVGDAMRMRFRVKSIDRRRGFSTYFWKAAPSHRPTLEF